MTYEEELHAERISRLTAIFSQLSFIEAIAIRNALEQGRDATIRCNEPGTIGHIMWGLVEDAINVLDNVARVQA